MSSKLLIPDEELGRFLVAYYRGDVFPRNYHLGQSFLLFYGLMGYKEIRHEKDDDIALDHIRDTFTGRLG